MQRREFILSAAALAAGGGAVFQAGQRIEATVDYPGREAGHRLRDARALPEPTETVDTEVLIAGGGIAGLTAAWALLKSGVRDTLLITGPEPHGNAAGGRDGNLAFPTGAHYLPLPSMESTHVREMLADLGIIQAAPFAERPTYDERHLVHGPAERVLYRGAWQDGYLPADTVSAAERSEHERFFELVDAFTSARGSDGRRAFVVPLVSSSTDERFRALDRVTFKAWLDAGRFASPTLHWYLNYCCRDDYGRGYEEISAWAGLHYFCSRDGLAANAERGAVLTWPQGLSYLADRLASGAGPIRDGVVVSMRPAGAGVEALVVESRGASGESHCYRVTARHAVAAMPLFVLKHVVDAASMPGFDAARDVPAYAPWIVSNFILRAFPEERTGVPLAWDNVVYQEPGLGFVVSTHQDIRLSRPERTAFTAYHALSNLQPDAAREWLMQASLTQLTRAASQDLRLAYGWRLPICVERVAITVRGHAMAIPAPGFLSTPGRLALRNAPGPIYFAHADLSGLSVFEEAAWWGRQAAQRIVAARA
jgi:hypothetical protein